MPSWLTNGISLHVPSFVLDADNVIRYVEYVDNINTEPDFEAAIAAVKELD